MNESPRGPMPESAEPSTPPPGPPAWWLVARVLDEPGAVFRALAQRPRILGPLVALVVVSFLAGFGTPADQLREQARQQASVVERRADDMPPEQAQQIQERTQEMIANAASTRNRLTVAIVGALFPIIGFVVVAAILMLVFGTTGSTPVSFRSEFAVVAHAYVPQLAGAVLVVVLGIAGVENTQLSLGFLSDMESAPFLFTLLSQFSLFAAWNMVLLAVGNQVLTGAKGLGGPLAVVGGLWVLKNFTVAGFVGLAAGMIG